MRGRGPFLLLAVVQVTLLMAMMVIAVALPTIQREFDLSGESLALVNGANPVAFCGLLLLGGRIGDVYGRRGAFVIGAAIFAVGSAGSGLATGFGTLLAARFAQGCGAALAAPAALGLLGAVFPDADSRTRATAAWGALPIVGGALALLLSGPIVTWASWRWAFAAPAVVGVAAVVLARRVLPYVGSYGRQRLDLPGGSLVTAGLALSCYGLLASEAVAVALGVLLLGAFVLVEARSRDPLLPVALLASVRRLIGLAGIAAGAAGVFTVSFFLPLYFQQTRGFSPAATSAAFIPYAAMMFVTSSFTGRVVARAGDRRTTVAGLVIGAAGLLLLSAMSPGPVFAGLVVLPAGASLVFSGTTVAAMDGAPETHAGVAGGLLNTAMEWGPTLGFAVLVSVASAWTARLDGPDAVPRGYGAALTVAAALYLLIAAATAAIDRTGPTSPRERRRPVRPE